MFADYPGISEHIFTFNIDVRSGDPDGTLADDKIGYTIFQVFKLFFQRIENVAIYVCDTLDERHLARKRKFDLWFWKFNDGSLLKEDGIAVVEGKPIYNSLLVHKSNKHWPEIVLAYSELNERAGEEK